MAIIYMVNMETCPDAATRAAITELRELVSELRQDLDTVSDSVANEATKQSEAPKAQATTTTKRRRTAKKAGEA